jgi:GT2 family glycosyltransferase
MRKIQNGIVVLNYNSYDDTVNCIDLLIRAVSDDDMIVIIDNASPDASGTRLKDYIGNKPELVFLQAENNRGYACGNNIGIEYLLSQRAEYITICNPDVMVNEDSMKILIDFMQENPDVCACGPLLLHPDQKPYIDCARNRLGLKEKFFVTTPLRIFDFFSIRERYYYHYNYEKSYPVHMLSGAFIVFRSGLLKKTGGYDSHTFLYQEEALLFNRIEKEHLGRVFFIHEAKAVHDHTDKRMSAYLVKHFRNSEQYYLKHSLQAGIHIRFIFWCIRSLQLLARR